MHFFLVKHSVDGLRLALQLGNLEELLVVGMPLPSLQLFQQGGSDSRQLSGRSGEVLVHCVDSQCGPHADVLAYFRRPDSSRQGAVLLYDRADQDLPPLQPEDQLDCFWEVEDFLSDGYLARLEELQQRGSFQGLSLYARRPGQSDNWAQRAEEISQALKHQLKPTTYELAEWSGVRS